MRGAADLGKKVSSQRSNGLRRNYSSYQRSDKPFCTKKDREGNAWEEKKWLTSKFKGLEGLSMVVREVEVWVQKPLRYLLWAPQATIGLMHLSTLHLPHRGPPLPHYHLDRLANLNLCLEASVSRASSVAPTIVPTSSSIGISMAASKEHSSFLSQTYL